jgi:hypothetical protein
MGEEGRAGARGRVVDDQDPLDRRDFDGFLEQYEFSESNDYMIDND